MDASQQAMRVKKDRKRAATQRKSCDTCHKSKTRCDRRRPVCSTCEIFNRTCTYLQRDQHGARESQQQESKARCRANTARSQISDQQPPSHDGYAADAAMYGAGGSVPQLTHSSSTASSADDLVDMIDELQSPFVTNDYQLSTCLEDQAQLPGWPPGPSSCSQFQQFDLSLVNGMDLVSGPDLSHTTAQFLMEAMAVRSDSESSTILAAIRMGMPWEVIQNALLATDYPLVGLGQIFAQQQQPTPTASNTSLGSPSSVEHSPSLVNHHPWEQPQYDPAQTTEWKELVGAIKNARPKDKASKPPPRLSVTTFRQGEGSRDIRRPAWATIPVRIMTAPMDPFDEAFHVMQAEVGATADIEAYCGSHAHLGALLHPMHSKTAPRLSQIIAKLVKNILPDEMAPSVTSLAMMWLHWCVWSWLLSPTQENFARIPTLLKPTPWQMHRPHLLAYNFIITNTLRDHVCQTPPTQNGWLTEAHKTISCVWPKTALHALHRNPVTRAIDLHPDCKAHVERAESWSYGPSLRAYLPDADLYAGIRTPG